MTAVPQLCAGIVEHVRMLLTLVPLLRAGVGRIDCVAHTLRL